MGRGPRSIHPGISCLLPASSLPLPEPQGAEPRHSPKAWGIHLNQLIAGERSHQRLNKHNLTEGMIIDLVKKRKKGKLN